MSEVWLSHLSVANWPDPVRWKDYFEQAQNLLGGALTHLDENDPVRRKVTSLDEAASYVCELKQQEQSRMIFGRFKTLGVEFSIECFRPVKQFANTVNWFFPLSYVDKGENQHRLKNLFNLGNQFLRPFYAYGDNVAQIRIKNRPSGAVDIQAELLGVFWLTYFNPAYVFFFGDQKFSGLPGVERASDGSITVVLGDSPQSVTNELRDRWVAALGNQSFVNPTDILGKQRGQYALTFQQLLAER